METLAEYINRYGHLITGITIDRGSGSEYFTVLNITNDKEIELGNGDIIDTTFLNSCDYIKFHLLNEITVKEEPLFNITFKGSEIREIKSLLNKCLIRLAETRNNDSKLSNAEVVSLEVNLQELINKLNGE